ncbi:hypothetical protein BDB01DRAFT_860101 [Pilobolus umbonatus]|nr:hypothetical protein BDB01DRAFT_860101 [Pilobolus umbonatus]
MIPVEYTQCPRCQALHWKTVKTSGTVRNRNCESGCKQGKVVILLLQQPPQFLVDLFTGRHEKSAHFLNNIRRFNAAFAFTSFGAKDLYIYDPEFAATHRNNSKNELDSQLISQITHLLHDECNNPFARLYQHAPEMKINLIVGSDRRTQNLPTANEIATIIPNEYAERSVRDIVITYRGNTDNESNFKRIHETHAAYMPLHYVMLFLRGDYGWI